jgi:hypothetical protein
MTHSKVAPVVKPVGAKSAPFVDRPVSNFPWLSTKPSWQYRAVASDKKYVTPLAIIGITGMHRFQCLSTHLQKR